MTDAVDNAPKAGESTNPDLKWYVVHAYSGMEKAVERNIIERIQRAEMQSKFGRILVPTEEVVEIVHDHLNQHVARKKLALGGPLLAILHLNHFFSGNQNATKFALHFCTLNALNDVALDSLLHARISMNHVPLQIGVGRFASFRRVVNSISHYFFHPKIRS